MTLTKTNTLPWPIESVSTKLVYFIYVLAMVFEAFIYTFPAVIYADLQKSLNTSVLVISWIYTALSIGYIISNVVCGCLIDCIKESHRSHSAIIFVCGIAVICVPFASNLFIIYALFIIIGIGMASIDSHFVLFVFRLYPMDGSQMYFWGIVIFNVFAVISTLFIQFALSMFGSYMYAFLFFGGVAIVHSIAILLIETPKHDEYRAIKRRVSTMQKDEIMDVVDVSTMHIDDAALAEAASTKLKECKRYQRLQTVTLVLLMFSMCLHAAQMAGFLSFTTVYTRDYLHVDDKFGSYFITSFWSGCLSALFLRQMFAPNSNPVVLVVATNLLRCGLQIAFIPISTMENPSLPLLVVYALCGATSGFYCGAICSWAELIRPTTGMIACLWWVLYGIGTATMTMSMGEVVDRFGAKWVPFVVCVPMFIAAAVNVTAVMTYRMIQKQEVLAFEEVKRGQVATASTIEIAIDAALDAGMTSDVEGGLINRNDTETVDPPPA